jgi:hypothetical protein
MAAVQFRNQKANIEVSKTMTTPKKQTLEAWFKDIRKIIPQVPNPKTTDWQIHHQEATIKWITFEMQNSVGERCVVVVDRQSSQFAR